MPPAPMSNRPTAAWRSARRACSASSGSVAGRSVRWIEERPVEPAADQRQPLAKRREPRLVVVAVLLGAADDVARPGLGIEELGAAGIGEGLLDRIDDLDEVGAGAGADDGVERRLGLGSGSRKSPNSTTSVKRRSARVSGFAGLAPRQERGEPLGGVPRQDRVALAEEADALAGGGEKLGEREAGGPARGRAW